MQVLMHNFKKLPRGITSGPPQQVGRPPPAPPPARPLAMHMGATRPRGNTV
jgi:hypothetical protein